MGLPSRQRWIRRARMTVMGLFAASSLLSRTSEARCCSADADCPRGFRCTTLPGSNGTNYGFCDNDFVDCRCDADCAPGLICMTPAKTLCVDNGAGGSTCGPAGSCVPPWQAPCATDSDCGSPSFQCVTHSAGGICDDSGCHHFASCELRFDACGDASSCPPLSCTSNAGCPADWTCDDESADCVPSLPISIGPKLIGDGGTSDAGPSPSATVPTCHRPFEELVGGPMYAGYHTPPGVCPSRDAGVDAAPVVSTSDAGPSSSDGSWGGKDGPGPTADASFATSADGLNTLGSPDSSVTGSRAGGGCDCAVGEVSIRWASWTWPIVVGGVLLRRRRRRHRPPADAGAAPR